MKWFKVFLLVLFPVSVWAHNTVKVQTLSEALEKHSLDSKLEFQDQSLAGKETYLKKIRTARDANHELFQCQVAGDWGPITVLVIVDSAQKSVVVLEILSYVDHVGPGILNPNFLKQFQELTAENLGNRTIQPLPQEPKTSLALLEAVRSCLAP